MWREYDIVRPTDITVKTMPGRNNKRIAIIHDRHIDLEEIVIWALTFRVYRDELDTIVEAGTKIDIDYYYNGFVFSDEDQTGGNF